MDLGHVLYITAILYDVPTRLELSKKIVAIISTTGRNNRGGLDAILRRLYFESFDAPEMFRRKRNVTKSVDDDVARRLEAP